MRATEKEIEVFKKYVSRQLPRKKLGYMKKKLVAK